MRYQPIPSSLFADRRDQFAKKMVRGSMAIFCSNAQVPRSGDQVFPFRQDPALFALSGIDQPGTIIILFPAAKRKADREIAFILPQDPEHAIWHGERLTAKQASQISGISAVYDLDRWDNVMPRLISDATSVYVNSRQPDRMTVDCFSPNDRMAEKLSQQYPALTLIDAQSILRQMMMVKHPVELALMKTAVGVTGEAFDRVLRVIKPGMKEYEIESELTYVLSRNGCQHAFEPIVASGKSACTLHYVRNDREIKKGELVLIDFGAEYAGMASDMTRTVPASGVFTSRQKAIYTSVLKVLKEVTDIMRPGVTIDELNKEAGSLIERELVNLRILTKRDIRRQDPKHPLRRKYFMHGIGHHLGYDVHDISDRTARLKPGMVITCEPGLYIPEEQTGIRLENDILITRGKPKNLMQHIPIEPEEIEDIMHLNRKEELGGRR
jgi:Xaa-Pro aminopeptidase